MRKASKNGLRKLIMAGIVVFLLTGCSATTPTEPNGGSNDQASAPALPAPELLQFNFGFFGQAEKTAGSNENFFNAAIRVAVIEVITDFILIPPVAAISLALHTVPSPQDDGSYLWVYTWVDGEEEAQIRLRGRVEGSRVAWELRVSSTEETSPIVNELWFEGETWNDGDTGFFRFHDFGRNNKPIVARLDWDSNGNDQELIFTDLDENPGDELAWRKTGSVGSVEFLDSSEDELWFIRFDESDGTGSLRADDYNNGEEACWDDHQNDIACSPAI